jgi:hypothetical protein
VDCKKSSWERLGGIRETKNKQELKNLVTSLEQLRDMQRATFVMAQPAYHKSCQIIETVAGVNEKRRAAEWFKCIRISEEKTQTFIALVPSADVTLTSNRTIVNQLKRVGYFTAGRALTHPSCPLTEQYCMNVSV